MKNNLKILAVLGIGIFALATTWISLVKFSSYYVPFYLISSVDPQGAATGKQWLVNAGHKNVDEDIHKSNLIFNNFHGLLIPAIKSYLRNKSNSDVERAMVTFFLPYLEDKTLRQGVKAILGELLKSDDYQQRSDAATAMRNMDTSVIPDLIEAWKRKDERGIKMELAKDMLQIGDKSVIPTLDADVGKNTDEDVFASIVLYQMTRDEKYKRRIMEMLKAGTREQRAFAIVFMGGMDAQMVPFLRQATKDQDLKLRKVAKENLDKLLHPDEKEKSYLEVLRRSPLFKDSKVVVE